MGQAPTVVASGWPHLPVCRSFIFYLHALGRGQKKRENSHVASPLPLVVFSQKYRFFLKGNLKKTCFSTSGSSYHAKKLGNQT